MNLDVCQQIDKENVLYIHSGTLLGHKEGKKYIVCGEIDATVDFHKLGEIHMFLSFVDPRSYSDK